MMDNNDTTVLINVTFHFKHSKKSQEKSTLWKVNWIITEVPPPSWATSDKLNIQVQQTDVSVQLYNKKQNTF